MSRIYDADVYRKSFNGSYTKYIWNAYRQLKKHIPKNAKKVLSIGCGTGDIESLMHYEFGLYDPFSPIQRYRNKPTGQYDYAYAYGAVMSAALPDERPDILSYALNHAPAFLVHTGFKDHPQKDDCMSYTVWDEAELFAGYAWRWVGRNLIEVKHEAR